MFFLLILSLLQVDGQVITADKEFPKATDELLITFYADRGNQGLMGYTGDVYAHTGLITTESISPSDWKYVKADWEENIPEAKMTRIGTDVYQLSITPDVNSYYGVSEEETILQLAFVFRSSDNLRTGRNEDGSDIFLDLYDEGLQVKIIQPDRSPLIVTESTPVTIEAATSHESNIRLFINDDEIISVVAETIFWEHYASVTGQHWIWVEADDGISVVYDSVYYFARGEVPVAELPPGMIPGVNYLDDHTAIVVLHDPPALKEYVFLTGDFNDWLLTDDHYMNRTSEGTYYWTTLSNLVPRVEYAYQFLIDGDLRIADPYTHKVLDPFHDQYISSETYPDLKPYPEGATTGIVSILETGQSEYQWEVTDFSPPEVQDLVIYELLIRDFVATSDIKTVIDTLEYLERLGVNAIELMPVNQFEGNDSWGYNPSFYFATDKAYGRRDDYKRFIDECHKRGIAVILDMVLNHSYGQSPMVQMYFDPHAGNYGKPTADNPWYNEVCPHPPFCWGHDFNHESPYTKEFVDRVNRFWLEEFNIDGFRFDFTKGFTNTQTADEGSAYDASRIAILKRMADEIWQVNDEAYVILEHFAHNSEETELAEYGMLLWGNMNYNYNEATMGYIPNSNLEGASYRSRGWDSPHLVSYMESHDEERLMYRNIRWGNSNRDYDTKQKGTALRRMELASTFYFTIPGPKMIWQFGELGYDYSINHCPDGSVSEECRTGRKPVRWDYYEDWSRKRLFDIYSILIDLKKSHPVFGTDDFSTSLAGEMKKIHLNHPDNQVTVLGNFGVTSGDITPDFQTTGTWYEFFTRESLDVTDVSAVINMQPGEYRLYSKVEFPDHGIPLSATVTGPQPVTDFSVYPNPSADGLYIRFWAGDNRNIEINVYNMEGKKIANLLNENLTHGFHEIYWDRSFSSGGMVSGGVYLVEIISGQIKSAKQVVFY